MDKVVINDGNNDGGAKVAEPKTLTPEEIAAQEAANNDGGANDTKDIISIDDTEYILNENGDALNEDGSIFKTKAEIDELSSSNADETQVEIDGNTFTLDDKGNAIDENGEIKFTKEQIDEMASDDTPAIDISEVINDTAIEIYDDAGNKVEYSNDAEGIKKYVSDVYARATNDGVNQLFEAYPQVKELINHFQLGGTIDNFNSQPDYNNIELNKENEAQLKDIIVQARTLRGDRPDAIDRYYNALKAGDKDNDTIFKEASLELDYLKGVVEEQNKTKEQQLEQQRLQQQQELNKYWGFDVKDGQIVDLGVENSVYSIINKGVIKLNDKSFVIPEKIKVVEDGKTNIYSRQDFLTYLTQPITVNIDGRPVTTTRADLDVRIEQSKRNVHSDVYDALRRFAKYDDSQFIEEQVNRQKVNKIRKLTSKKKNSNSNVSVKKTGVDRVVIK